MKAKCFLLPALISSVLIGSLPAAEKKEARKPDFSGVWRLDWEASKFYRPSFREGPRGGGGDFGGGGMGGPGGMGGGMGGPGMGGPGMGGGGMGRGGMGGGGQQPSGREQNLRMLPVAETLVIQHRDPEFRMQVPMRMGPQTQMVEIVYTTDGEKIERELPGGMEIRSKTRWRKNRLVTESDSAGPMGSSQILEERQLSEDGRTMTVEVKMRNGFMELRRKLIYRRVQQAAGP
ncbi:MAG: hypothetical protein Kow00109_22970 [Acidobacteriota bacterium]